MVKKQETSEREQRVIPPQTFAYHYVCRVSYIFSISRSYVHGQEARISERGEWFCMKGRDVGILMCVYLLDGV